jgi:transcription elongation factor GreA
MQKEPMTPGGYQKLKDELNNLLKVERPQNVKAIAEARAHGDLSPRKNSPSWKDASRNYRTRLRGPM